MTTTAFNPSTAIGTSDFIATHGLWNEEQIALATEIEQRVAHEDLRSVRVSAVDAHGTLRGKAVFAGLFGAVLRNGIDYSPVIYHFDPADSIVFNAFAEDAGLGDERFAGAPDLVLVPDPTTFCVLPWAPRTGWCIGSMYYTDGTPVPLDPRHVLKDQLDRLHDRSNLRLLAGLEVEFYLARLVPGAMDPNDIGAPGAPPPAPLTTPLAQGYRYQSEDLADQVSEVYGTIADQLLAVGLPLRTMENEWGPGQCEFTFSPQFGMHAADSMMLFRSAVRQIARRMDLHATFMSCPALPGYFASGWHLHQSLLDDSGTNVFATAPGAESPLSDVGRQYVAGLLEHADAGSLFASPTVNGYRRRKPFSLAPDRSTWALDNRAAMVRVQGGAGDPATHIENRIGEPAANPYLYLASQVAAGMDGMSRDLDPGEPEVEPYSATHRPLLPTHLKEALEATGGSDMFRREFGDRFIDWLVGLKQFELDRFTTAVGDEWDPETVTDWEQREYFTRF